MSIPRHLIICLLLSSTFQSSIYRLSYSYQVKQSPEVVEAYRVCKQFERLLSESQDFERAYEATFSKNVARRRAIAIADGEFGSLDFTGIDDETLISAYKKRMQIFYLLLPLASPDNEKEETLFFPQDINQILDRKPPHMAQEFRSYAAQLKRDVLHFHEHLEHLSARYPAVAERIRKFKVDARAVQIELPGEYMVKPQHGSARGGILSKEEAYYEIGGYTVIREDGQMRIVGIKFFNKLF